MCLTANWYAQYLIDIVETSIKQKRLSNNILKTTNGEAQKSFQ